MSNSGNVLGNFTVDTKGSHPETGDNDDWWASEEFATESEALAAFNAPCADRDSAYIVLSKIVGHTALDEKFRTFPIVEQLAFRKNPAARKRDHAAEDAAWRREIANEAGMLHGVDAYNEAMGD